MSDYATKLAEAAKEIETINIKGKEYATVNERLGAFWTQCPDGYVTTEMLSDDGNRCVFKAAVFEHMTDPKPKGTGHAFEVKSGMINSTSYLENCETSALGRALANAGFGIVSAIASADEVQNAIRQQESQSKAPKQAKRATTAKPAEDARKSAYSRIAEKKKACIAKGIREEGIEEWYAAYIGQKGLNRCTDEELGMVERYLDELLEG